MKKVLIIEDDQISKLAYELSLKNSFDLALPDDLNTIISDFGKKAYDIILMDINLGANSLNGIEIMTLLKKTHPNIKTKFVAVTAYAQSTDKNKFLELGFDGYLSKPVDFDYLPNYLSGL